MVPELGKEGLALGSCAMACPSLTLKASLLPLASISNEFLIKMSQHFFPEPGYWTLTCSPNPHASGDCCVLERGQQRLTALREDDSVHF
ncbi:hypothetical protein ACRRTK_017831 [Alexandromys fortis]